MDISIIIVSFNTRELLIDCLNSLIVAVKNFKSEIFVVDNNSHDKTVETIEKLFGEVKVIANSQNLGFSKANNQAIKKAKGKYIVILNPDTKVMPNAFKTMMKFMDENLSVAVSTCRIELPNGELDRDCRRLFPTPWRALCQFLLLSKIFRGSRIFDQYQMGYLKDSIVHEIDSCVGAFMFVRASAIKKVGLFDEDFFFYGEDLDWCWRFKEAGYKIFYNPQAKIIHYKGAASGMKQASRHLTKATLDSKKRAIRESTRAMELFYKKHLLDRYPRLLTLAVLLGVKSIEKIRLFNA